MAAPREDRPRVLVVLSDPADAALYAELLQPHSLRLEFTPALSDVLEECRRHPYALVIVQVRFPGPAVRVLSGLRLQLPDQPLVVVGDPGIRYVLERTIPSLTAVPILDEPVAEGAMREVLEPILHGTG